MLEKAFCLLSERQKVSEFSRLRLPFGGTWASKLPRESANHKPHEPPHHDNDVFRSALEQRLARASCLSADNIVDGFTEE